MRQERSHPLPAASPRASRRRTEPTVTEWPLSAAMNVCPYDVSRCLVDWGGWSCCGVYALSSEVMSASNVGTLPADRAYRTSLYAATVIVGACLLFLVQPLIAKIILPWFGGTSAVWSAALVFFQACVLGGYSYAHWLTTHVSPKRQSLIHGALLIVSCLMMPILPSEALRPDGTGDPALQIL